MRRHIPINAQGRPMTPPWPINVFGAFSHDVSIRRWLHQSKSGQASCSSLSGRAIAFREPARATNLAVSCTRFSIVCQFVESWRGCNLVLHPPSIYLCRQHRKRLRASAVPSSGLHFSVPHFSVSKPVGTKASNGKNILGKKLADADRATVLRCLGLPPAGSRIEDAASGTLIGTDRHSSGLALISEHQRSPTTLGG